MTSIADAAHARTDAARSRRLIKIQAISGLVFLIFALVHLVNTMLASLGPAAYDGFQRVARLGYQFPLLEIALVIVPLIVHVSAGIARILERRKHAAGTVPRRVRAHRLTGYFLLAVIAGHVIATRGPSVVRGIYPEFTGLSFSLTALPAVFFPYYVMLALAGLYHGLNGATIALPALGVRVPEMLRRGAPFYAALGAGSLLLVLGVLGLGGVLFDVPDSSGHPFARLAAELFGSALPSTAE